MFLAAERRVFSKPASRPELSPTTRILNPTTTEHDLIEARIRLLPFITVFFWERGLKECNLSDIGKQVARCGSGKIEGYIQSKEANPQTPVMKPGTLTKVNK
ncbi:unnamed protein product [Prunus armeniaca]|uniref:Uncharacterized protein n=1 Tax=Prunus armeniaca TaxID=36596 RepID=A0A6J5VNV4_PRUAR|nr:unnamed protein product [Prunus armeniaca]CAB4293889.1 unnamed protein product [Prunus armeniaca]